MLGENKQLDSLVLEIITAANEPTACMRICGHVYMHVFGSGHVECTCDNVDMCSHVSVYICTYMCLPCIHVYVSVRQACAHGLSGFGQLMLKMVYLQLTSNPEPIPTTTGEVRAWWPLPRP